MKLWLAFVSIIVLCGVAYADKKEQADALFKQGKKHMEQKRFADACEAFEKSNKLDPAIGTQLNIAKCYEEWGKIGQAYLAYQAAEKQAASAKDSREPKIHELVVALEPNIPHLTIKVPKDAPIDLKVTLDNRPVEKLGDAFVVDPGPHTIEWWAKGGAKKSKIVPVERGGDSEVTLEMPIIVGGTGAKPGEGDTTGGGDKTGGGGDTTITPPPATSKKARNMKLGGMVLGGAGVVAIGISSYMAFSARDDYHNALDMYCGGMTNNCSMMGLELTHDARSTANKATVVFIVGVAMIGGGAALYFLAPKGPAQPTAPAEKQESSFYLTPSVSPDGVGVVLGGTL